MDGFVFVQSESGASFEEVTEALADHVVDSDDAQSERQSHPLVGFRRFRR